MELALHFNTSSRPAVCNLQSLALAYPGIVSLWWLESRFLGTRWGQLRRPAKTTHSAGCSPIRRIWLSPGPLCANGQILGELELWPRGTRTSPLPTLAGKGESEKSGISSSRWEMAIANTVGAEAFHVTNKLSTSLECAENLT